MERALPAYYYENGWLESKLAQIRYSTQIVDGDSFVFITDTHVLSNMPHSKDLLKQVKLHTTVKNIFFGGDAVQAYGSNNECLRQAEIMLNYANEIGDCFYTMKGNHDFTVKRAKGEESGFTASLGTIYDFVMRRQENRVHGVKGGCYFYIDNPVQRIRYIALDAFEDIAKAEDTPWGVRELITQEQYNWLINEALNINGYTIIVFAHAPGDESLPSSCKILYPVADMLRALNNRRVFSYSDDNVKVNADFTTSDNIVAAFICGHNHGDYDIKKDGLLMISTTSDAPYNDDSKWIRQKGTTSEHAFDVFTVNTKNKTISTVRVGAGENRKWSYGL